MAGLWRSRCLSQFAVDAGPARRRRRRAAAAGQQVELRLRLSGTAPEPMTFTIDNPARISLDLPNTGSRSTSRRKDVERRSARHDPRRRSQRPHARRPELDAVVPYQTRVEGNSVYVTLGQAPGEAPPGVRRAAAAAALLPRAGRCRRRRAIRNIDFRRGADGAGQVVVELYDPRTTVDVRQEGGRIVVDFQNTTLPRELHAAAGRHRLRDAGLHGRCAARRNGARLIVTAARRLRSGRLPVRQPLHARAKPPVEQAAATGSCRDEDREYTGERLTLNFQDLETRAGAAADRGLQRPEHRRQRHGAGQRHAAPAERAVGSGARHRA